MTLTAGPLSFNRTDDGVWHVKDQSGRDLYFTNLRHAIGGFRFLIEALPASTREKIEKALEDEEKLSNG